MEDNTTETQVTQQTSELTEAKVQELALKAMLEQQQKTVKEQNLATVQDTLQKVFGAEAEHKVEAKCKELGITKEFGMGIAKDSPKAFLKLLGLDEPAKVTMEDIISKGRLADTTPADQVAPRNDMERLVKDPRLAKDQKFLQGLFQTGMKDPSQILMAETEWAPIGQ